MKPTTEPSFSHVMSIARRMCAAQGACCLCPAFGIWCPFNGNIPSAILPQEVLAFEAVALDWGDEHPEEVT